MLLVLVRPHNAQREIQVEEIRRRVIGHLPSESHACADVAEQRQTVLQARILVQRDQHLIGHLTLDVARRKRLGCEAQMLVHGPIDARRCAADAQNLSHLGDFAIAQSVTRAERELNGRNTQHKIMLYV